MRAKAVTRTIRIAPRKVRLVLDLIRSKDAAKAIAISKLTNKASSPIIEKVLMSVLANAEHNYDMNTDELVVKEAYADEGPILKRFRPHAQDRASAINRCISHIIIIVSNDKEKARGA